MRVRLPGMVKKALNFLTETESGDVDVCFERFGDFVCFESFVGDGVTGESGLPLLRFLFFLFLIEAYMIGSLFNVCRLRIIIENFKYMKTSVF